MHAGTDPADEDEYYSDEEGQHKPPPEFNMDALADFIDRVEPLFNLHLNANQEQRAFDNYEVVWEEEFGEINDLHCLQTDYDFVQANQAVQKTLNMMNDSETQASTKGRATGFDDWDDKPSQSSSAAGATTQSRGGESSSQAAASLDSLYSVTSVAWNCNGSQLAVAYGKMNHVSWCEH